MDQKRKAYEYEIIKPYELFSFTFIFIVCLFTFRRRSFENIFVPELNPILVKFSSSLSDDVNTLS